MTSAKQHRSQYVKHQMMYSAATKTLCCGVCGFRGKRKVNLRQIAENAPEYRAALREYFQHYKGGSIAKLKSS